MGPFMSEVTRMLDEIREGKGGAAEDLLPLVYEELRHLAAARMAQQPPGHTLQATALVHEAWLKLSGSPASRWHDRKHFFRTAAAAMHQILIDRARRRLRARHAGDAIRIDPDNFEIAAPAKEETLLKLDEALTELRALAPERAEIVQLRFFAGLTEPEIAGILGISERSVQRQWSHSRAWLFDRIGQLP